ncbi:MULTISPECIES: (2Fe-2S)-binding protein [unclassified Moraxella]|uniref:(2Fe-2S)-binding protein n=1 Tax=unclassified Moraxella TaxID=2685852 RepID=UPI003AF7A561
MFVCICNAVKEAQIKEAIRQGHDTLESLQNELDVATCCGGCQPMIEDYLQQHHDAVAIFNPKTHQTLYEQQVA